MSTFELYDDDRAALPAEFLKGMDYSGKFLEGLERTDHKTIKEKTNDIHSLADAEQALTDTLAFLATEGTKQMDSNTVALLIKTISDTRTLLTSGDVLRDDTETSKDVTTEKTVEPNVVSTGGGGGNVEQTTAPAPDMMVENQDVDPTDNTLRKIIARLEQHISWSRVGYDLDVKQVEYLARLKAFVSHFKNVKELLLFCERYASYGQGRLWPSTVVFLVILFLSDTPERYMAMFVLSPLSFYENPLKGTRSYEFDGVLSFYDTQRTV